MSKSYYFDASEYALIHETELFLPHEILQKVDSMLRVLGELFLLKSKQDEDVKHIYLFCEEIAEKMDELALSLEFGNIQEASKRRIQYDIPSIDFDGIKGIYKNVDQK